MTHLKRLWSRKVWLYYVSMTVSAKLMRANAQAQWLISLYLLQ